MRSLCDFQSHILSPGKFAGASSTTDWNNFFPRTFFVFCLSLQDANFSTFRCNAMNELFAAIHFHTIQHMKIQTDAENNGSDVKNNNALYSILTSYTLIRCVYVLNGPSAAIRHMHTHT